MTTNLQLTVKDKGTSTKMPLNKTYRDVLDRSDSPELVLEIPSFAGGENTVGQDQELKVNEARVIENWDSDSLGGMVRSKGFTQIASGLNYIKAVVFTGAGLNDATSGGTYSGTVNATYTVIIDATGTPDTFKWKKNSGSFTTGVAITGSAQTLSDGVTITFAATTGHTLNDQWVITAISYTAAPDGALHHFEGTSTRNYVIIEGDVAYINGSAITKIDIGAFTSGVLTHGLSAGNKAWFTNATDNLKFTTIAGTTAAPTGTPPNARERIYYHKSRLVAEGGGVTVYGSRVGTGNWAASANTWTASGDAWSIDLPDLTQGCVPGFPTGGQITVFTKFGAYALTNMPNIAQNYILGSHGCSQAESIQLGAEGVYFFSLYPTLGVYLWNGSSWINLTVNETWVNQVSLTNRCFGIYSENKYRFFYNDNTSGVSYPNVERVYDARWGRWNNRVINSSVADNFGIPFLLTKANNELYCTSSRVDKVYQLEDTSNSDNTNDTQANYKTKDFTSKDFGAPRDEIRMKLLKATVSFFGTTGLFSLQWTSDRGAYTGSIIIDMQAPGDLLNTTFTVNTSSIISASSIPDKTVTKSFKNSAVGRRFSFQLLNNGTGERVKIKKIKILGIALEEA